jgi:hypothetical protein
MSALRKNIASQVVTFSLVNATTGAALTGATVTVKATLDGTQSAGAGTVTELGTGQYKYVPTQGETNGTTLGLGFTATNAVPVNLHCFITANDPTNATTGGLGNLDAAVSSRMATFTLPTNFSSLAIDATGRVNAFLIGILTTVFTEGATGRIAAAFKQFFNIATPAATMDHGVLVDTVTTTTTATTATNLTNAPTAGDFTATMKTSLNAATPAVTVSDKTGFSLSAAGVQAIWDALSSALTTVGSIGKRLVDDLTGDIYARLGAPAGASVSADIAAAKSDTAAVKLQTDKLAFTVTNQVDANVLDWKSATAPAMTGDAFARLGAPAGASVSADIAALPTAASNATGLLDLAAGVETGLTLRQAMRLLAAASAGKLSGAATTTIVIRNAVADSKNRITATCDSDGNRSAITVDLT